MSSLRLVNALGGMPVSFMLDPSASFLPGQCGQLAVIGGQVMCTVSNGTAPIGVIDDMKTKSFTNISWNESVWAPAVPALNSNNQYVTAIDVKVELAHASIIPASFNSTVNCVLNPVNGIITFPAGTPLNFDAGGSGTYNAIRSIINYTYYVPNIPGDDSTAGSNRVTVWVNRFFFQTTSFETNQQYPLNANVYVNEFGFFTTRKPSENHPCVGLVTAPPTSYNSSVEILFL